MKRRSITDIVSEPAWQSLRASLVGTWREHPARNVNQLRRYLDGRWDDDDALRRVHNYLVGSAFRIGVIRHHTITRLLDEVRAARGKGGKS